MEFHRVTNQYKYRSSLRAVAGSSHLASIYIEGPPNSESSKGTSYYNTQFAEIVREVVYDLIDNATIDGKRVQERDILIISVYKGSFKFCFYGCDTISNLAQQYATQGLFKKNSQVFVVASAADKNTVRILTADQVQGLQAPIVIIDLVRSGADGFMQGHIADIYGFKQNGRFVLAMTRAQIRTFWVFRSHNKNFCWTINFHSD